MMASSHTTSTSPRGGRPLVENAIALRVRDLRSRWGWLRTLDIDAADGSTVKVSLDVRAGDAVAWISVEHWPAGSRWSTTSYEIEIGSTPQHLGGRRWWMRCPVLGVRASALYFPPGGDRLASRQAHSLAFASQRQRAPARAASRAHRLATDLGASGLDVPARPKGMWRSTFDRRAAALARLVEVAAAV